MQHQFRIIKQLNNSSISAGASVVALSPAEGIAYSDSTRRVAVSFANTCNIACSYCGLEYSKPWQEDIARWGPYPATVLAPIVPASLVNFVDDFWQSWPVLYSQLEEIALIGGEPLSDDNSLRVLEYVSAIPSRGLRVTVDSSFGIPEEQFDRYLGLASNISYSQVGSFVQRMKLDTGIADHAEYVHNGMSYLTTVSRAIKYLRVTSDSATLEFAVTLTNLSVVGLVRLLEMIINLRRHFSHTQQRVTFTINPATSQHHSLSIIPEISARAIDEAVQWAKQHPANNSFVGFTESEVALLESLCTTTLTAADNAQLAGFYRFFSARDKRTRTDFLNVFPYLSQAWNRGRHYAELV